MSRGVRQRKDCILIFVGDETVFGLATTPQSPFLRFAQGDSSPDRGAFMCAYPKKSYFCCSFARSKSETEMA